MDRIWEIFWEKLYYVLYVIGELWDYLKDVLTDKWDVVYYKLYMLYSYFYDFFHYSAEDIDSCCRR